MKRRIVGVALSPEEVEAVDRERSGVMSRSGWIRMVVLQWLGGKGEKG